MVVRLFAMAVVLGASNVAALGDSRPNPEAFFRRPEIISPVLSPDGNHLAYIAEIQGKPMVIHLDLSTGTAEGLTRGENIERLSWKGNERIVCGGGFATSATINIRTRAVTPLGGKGLLDPVYIKDYADDFRDLILVESREHIALLNLNTGKEEELLKSASKEPFGAGRTTGYYAFDAAGAVRAYLFRKGDETQLLFRNSTARNFAPVKHWNAPETPWRPVGFSVDGSKIYVLARGDADFVQLQVYDPEVNTLTPLAGMPLEAEILGVLFSPRREMVIGVQVVDRSDKTQWLDSGWQKFQATLDASFPNKKVTVAGYSEDGRVCLLVVASSEAITEWYVLNREKHDLRLVVKEAGPVQGSSLCATLSVDIPSRDGLTIHGYLTKSGASFGPLVLEPYRAPFAGRFRNTYDAETQFLASRGYSVLQVDYRGVAGYGEKYESAGRGEIAGRIIDDINDAARWAINQGHTKAGGICLYGEEFAAGLALVAAAEDPESYGCIVIKNGNTDWKQYAAARPAAYASWFATSTKSSSYPVPLDSIALLKAPVLEIRRSENLVNAKLRGAFRAQKKSYALAGFLDPKQYHDEFAYQSFDAANLVKFLNEHLPVR
ncbi:MAG: Dipeptidyl aminopeptidase/acylaminoacyl-peptidase [Lacunisphaera sp.]|nr:Dipeptidyl aminopeptidase/acylaminoacyl-peptidase [Lacunisphaera sp.]